MFKFYLLFFLAVINIEFFSQGLIKGKLTTENEEKLPGINIFLEGTPFGTSSSIKGDYSLKVKPGKYDIVFSGIGYKTEKQNILINNGDILILNIKMREESLSLDEVFITADRMPSYVENTSYSASKIPVDIKVIPQGIHILPQKIMEQLRMVRIDDGIRYLSGINMETGFGGRTDIYQIRGFRIGWESIFKNGFRNSMRTYRETGNIKQIEVLKGPASVLYGMGDPGGLINIVTKKPLSKPYFNFQITANNFGLIRPAFDISGPLNKKRTLRFRINGVYEEGKTYRDFVKTERFFVAPVLSYDFSDKTSLTIEGEILKHNQPSDRGIVYDGTNIIDVPFSRSLGEPDNEGKFFNTLWQYDLTHKLNKNLVLKHRLNFNYTKEDRSIVEQNTFLKKSKELISRRFQLQDNYERYIAAQNEVYVSFSSGNSINHRALLGVEISNFVFDINYIRVNYDTLNVYNPKYSRLPKSTNGASPTSDYKVTDKVTGFYVQDVVSLFDRLHVLAGLRYDIFNENMNDRKSNDNSVDRNTSINPRIGILYNIYGPVSIYGNYSKSFQPQFGQDINGNEFDPLSAMQFETGLKSFFFNDKLSFTASVYQVKQINILTVDKNDPNFQTQVGEVKSNGLELDITGELFPGLNLLASYSFINARVTKDNSIKAGTKLKNVSPHNINFWGTYQIQKGILQGFGLGIGILSVQSRPGDTGNSFVLPGYSRIDLTGFYEWNNIRFAVNIRNLTNLKYYEGAQSKTVIMPGAPFTTMASINYTL